MIIYLEGVDGAGKTVLAEKIAHRLEQLKTAKGIEIVTDGEQLIKTNPTAKDRTSEETLYLLLEKMASSLDTVYICDRGPISDIIYRVFDEHNSVTNLNKLLGFALHWRNLFTIVHCDNDDAFKDMMMRGDTNPVSVVYHARLRSMYNIIMPIFNAIKYDRKNQKELDIINVILAKVWTGREQYKTWQEILNNQQFVNVATKTINPKEN